MQKIIPLFFFCSVLWHIYIFPVILMGFKQKRKERHLSLAMKIFNHCWLQNILNTTSKYEHTTLYTFKVYWVHSKIFTYQFYLNFLTYMNTGKVLVWEYVPRCQRPTSNVMPICGRVLVEYMIASPSQLLQKKNRLINRLASALLNLSWIICSWMLVKGQHWHLFN